MKLQTHGRKLAAWFCLSFTVPTCSSDRWISCREDAAQTTVIAGSVEQSQPDRQSPRDDSSPHPSLEFTAHFVRTTRAAEPGNYAFSPLSIRSAFAMLQAGAGEPTAAELAEVFGLENTGTATAAEFAREMAELESRNSTRRAKSAEEQPPAWLLRVSNGIWVDDELPLRAEYAALLERDYDARAATLDFRNAPAKARETINAWIAERTDDQIRDMIGEGVITEATRAVLANTVLFRGRWMQEFAAVPAERAPRFRGVDGKEVEGVEFMRRLATLPVVEDEQVQAVTIGFEGKSLAMTFLVPRADDGLAAFESELQGPRLRQLLQVEGADVRRVSADITLPMFVVEANTDLQSPLRDMGLVTALSPSADYGGISEQPVIVDRAIHRARVEVDRKGVTASAATVITMRAGAERREPEWKLVADHPFAFVIHDASTGNVLFYGRCAKP